MILRFVVISQNKVYCLSHGPPFHFRGKFCGAEGKAKTSAGRKQISGE
jgi:hypothetical protein